MKHVNDILPDAKAEHLIMWIGASSGVSRLVFGKLSDYESVSRVRLQVREIYNESGSGNEMGSES